MYVGCVHSLVMGGGVGVHSKVHSNGGWMSHSGWVVRVDSVLLLMISGGLLWYCCVWCLGVRMLIMFGCAAEYTQVEAVPIDNFSRLDCR